MESSFILLSCSIVSVCQLHQANLRTEETSRGAKFYVTVMNLLGNKNCSILVEYSLIAYSMKGQGHEFALIAQRLTNKCGHFPLTFIGPLKCSVPGFIM